MKCIVPSPRLRPGWPRSSGCQPPDSLPRRRTSPRTRHFSRASRMKRTPRSCGRATRARRIRLARARSTSTPTRSSSIPSRCARRIASSCSRRNRSSGATKTLQRAAENGRVSARAHLARVLIADGRRDEAARELEGVLSTSGADADALAQAHRLRLGLERPDLEAELERAGRRALSAEARGLDEVRAAFERVLAFDTHIWEAYFGLGLVARRSDDFAAAAGSFRRALELAPEQADVMHELGVALLASGSRADALGLLDRAASLRPREAAYIADAGFAHLQAGDLGAARERLRIASTIDAHDPLTRAYLAELERVEAESGKAN